MGGWGKRPRVNVDLPSTQTRALLENEEKVEIVSQKEKINKKNGE